MQCNKKKLTYGCFLNPVSPVVVNEAGRVLRGMAVAGKVQADHIEVFREELHQLVEGAGVVLPAVERQHRESGAGPPPDLGCRRHGSQGCGPNQNGPKKTREYLLSGPREWGSGPPATGWAARQPSCWTRRNQPCWAGRHVGERCGTAAAPVRSRLRPADNRSVAWRCAGGAR